MNRPEAESKVGAGPDRTAVLMLLLANVFWGVGFTWAKAAGESVHRAAGLPDGSMLGPALILALRFTAGGVLLLALVPAARRGWTVRGAGRIAGVGVLLGGGLLLQHLALDRTSEAVTAFLTNLTVVFVPLLAAFVLCRPPAPVMWLGVALATAGVWMLTGAAPAGFGLGESLGVGCAAAFALYILSVNAAAVTENPWRLTAGQVLVAGLVCAGACLVARDGPGHVLNPAALARLVSAPGVWLNLLLLLIFPTLGAYVLLNRFQPRLDPTRTALIYLLEPVVAAVYAYAAMGRGPNALGWAGGALIIVANIVVEVLAARRASRQRRG